MIKKNIILALLLLVLLSSAYLYKNGLESIGFKKKSQDNIFRTFDFAQIDRMEVVLNQATTTMERSGDSWLIDGMKGLLVDDERNKTLVEAFAAAASTSPDLVSINPDKAAQSFGFNENSARVKLWQGDDLKLSIVIGRMATDLSSTYWQREGESSVYLSRAPLDAAFADNEWGEKQIFKGEPDSVNRLRIKYKKDETILVRKDNKWQFEKPKGGQADKKKVDNILRIMTSLEALSFPEQTFKGTDLEKNDLIVEASGDGFNNTIMVGKEDFEGNMPAKKGETDTIYKINYHDGADLRKTAKDLK